MLGRANKTSLPSPGREPGQGRQRRRKKKKETDRQTDRRLTAPKKAKTDGTAAGQTSQGRAGQGTDRQTDGLCKIHMGMGMAEPILGISWLQGLALKQRRRTQPDAGWRLPGSSLTAS